MRLRLIVALLAAGCGEVAPAETRAPATEVVEEPTPIELAARDGQVCEQVPPIYEGGCATDLRTCDAVDEAIWAARQELRRFTRGCVEDAECIVVPSHFWFCADPFVTSNGCGDVVLARHACAYEQEAQRLNNDLCLKCRPDAWCGGIAACGPQPVPRCIDGACGRE